MNTSFLEMNNFLRVSRSAVLTLLVLITVALQGVMGQVGSYLFTQTSGTYTALSSPTVWQSGTTISTDAVSAAVNIGFTFNFNGTGYTQLRISNNGFITFGATAPGTTIYNPLSAATGYAGAIAGYGINLVVSTVVGAAPEIAYLSSGTTPNRVFTVQYKDMGRFGGDRMNFQIQLRESGTIAVVYGTWAASTTTTATTNFGVVGLRGAANTDFNARMVYATAPYNTWATSGGAGDNGATARQTATNNTAGVNSMRYRTGLMPASGLTYTWTPVPSSFYQTLPYTQNFDSWSSSRSTGDVPASTGVINSPSAGNRSWRVSSTTAANAAWTELTGNFGAPTAQAGVGAAFFNQYNAPSASVGNLDFYLNISSAGNKQATFYVRNPGIANTNDVLRAYLSTDGGVTFILLTSYAAPIAGWTQQTLALGSSTSTTCVLRFQAVSDYGSTAENLGLDELSVEVVACGVPTTLSSSSLNYTTATINWVAPSGSPVGYQYEVRTSGAAGSGATGLAANGTTTSAVTANVTGLTGATAYTYYVRTNCGSSSFSTWASSTFTTLSCNVPTGVGSSAVATTTATISWTAPAVGSPTGYQWEVRSSNAAGSGATGLAASGSTTSPTVTANVTGLTASTAYSIYVRTNCAAGLNSGWTTAATFTTACPAGTVPFFEGFESGFTHNTAVGGCWSRQSVAGAEVWTANASLTTYNRSPRTGTRNAFLAYSNNDWLFYPLQLTGGVSYTFDVYARQDGATATDSDITLAYGTSATAAGMTNTVLAASGIVNGAYQLKSGTFTPASTGVYYIGIKGFMNGNPWYISLDDISVYETPSCSALPSALTSSSVTATSATISWTAASPAPGSGYHYYVSTSATAPTAGTTPTGTTAAGVVTANLTGLTANTTYYYWVRSNCNGVDFSTWAGSSTFYTGYCLVSITNSDFTGITNVTFNTINNTSVGDPAVTDFTAVSTTVAQGSAYTLSTRVNTDGNWTVNSKAWIDWNQNTVFDVPSEEYNLGSATNTANGITSLTPSVTVPVGAVVGTTYMRVGAVENSDPAPTACGNPLLYGEYEMYTIVVIAGNNCSGAPSAGTAPAATNVCSGGTTTLTVTGATTGLGISYQWEEWNGSAWVSAVGGSGATTTSYTTPALTAGKQYRFTVLCTPSSQSASTTGITITVGTPANDACATAQAITVGAAAITGSVACAAAGSGGCGGSTSDYDVWYSFTVGSTADYKINLLPSASFDGVFQLYNGCGGSLVSSPSNSYGAPESCIDGYYAGGLEFANYSLTPGTYFVRVYDYNGSGTAYPSTTTFTLEVVIPVSACDAPTNIASCGTNINTVIASGAGDWSGYYDCTTLFYDLLGKESVFTYTPAVTSSAYTLTVNSLSPSGTGNYINFLYKASTCSAAGVWNCIDERNGTGTTLPFSMTAGVTYYFLLKPELTTGYTINWRIDCPPAPPVNDACASATALPCGTSNLAGTTVASVSETVSIGCTMSQIGVWYSFVGNGFSTTVSSTATFDHEMGIASGSCGSLVNIACRDAASGTFAETHTFTTTVGVTYYIYIAHFGAANTSTGTFTISRTCTVNEWTGNALNTDWATNGNWSTGTAPTSSGTVYIPTSPTGANFPTIDEAAQIATLTLATGATLNIQSGNSMTVTGVLTNSGTISVANGGSLVEGTGSTLAGSGSYNVTRNGSSVYDYWSSPTTNVSSGFLGGTVYQYNPASGTADPSDDAFDPGWVGAGGSMVAAKGYAAYGAGTKTFTGTVNNGDIGIAVTSNASPNVSYNLIGNPYPSGVSVSTFLSTNSALLAVGAVYLWDNPGTTPYVTGDYAVRNALSGTAGGGGNAPTGVLGTAQGFKVNVNGNGTIQFTNAMRTASNTTNIFRQSETQLLWLNAISSDNRFNQTLVGFTEDGTDGNDWAYDAPKLNALGELSLYSYIDGEPLAIQAYGPFEQERIVPLGLNSDYQTVVTISLDSTENMDAEDIILEDRYYGLFHDLRVSSYVFQSSPMLYSDRFFLHFSPQMVTGVSSNTIAPEMQSYIANDMLNLRSNSRLTGTLQMFDMSGRMVLQSSNVTLGTELLKVDVSHLAKGVYSVRIQDSKKAHVQKVIK